MRNVTINYDDEYVHLKSVSGKGVHYFYLYSSDTRDLVAHVRILTAEKCLSERRKKNEKGESN